MKSKAVWPVVVVAALAMVMALGVVPVLRAGPLDTQVIALFPKDVGEFAYADMKGAQKYKWFPQLQQQILPERFRQFETFLKSAGIDMNSQVQDLAFAAIPANDKHPEEVLGVAEGEFQPDTTEENLKKLKLPTKKTHGFTMYAFGSGSSPYDIFFFFLDSNTAVFGQGDAIERMLSVRTNGDPSLLANNTLFPLINQVNGQGLIWAVLDQHYTRLGLKQLLPEVASAQQSSALFEKVHAMIISVDTSSDIQTQFEAVCGTPDDANNLAALLQAGILYRRYQATQSNPELAKMLDQATVTPRGDRLDLSFQLTEDQIVKLIEQRTFAVSM
jgi:hypothetical protein